MIDMNAYYNNIKNERRFYPKIKQYLSIDILYKNCFSKICNVKIGHSIKTLIVFVLNFESNTNRK